MSVPTKNTTSGGVIDQGDVHDWVARFNDALNNTKTVTAPAPTNAKPWYAPFFGCFTPIDTCEKTQKFPKAG
jgi:hypothetical protein